MESYVVDRAGLAEVVLVPVPSVSVEYPTFMKLSPQLARDLLELMTALDRDMDRAATWFEGQGVPPVVEERMDHLLRALAFIEDQVVQEATVEVFATIGGPEDPIELTEEETATAVNLALSKIQSRLKEVLGGGTAIGGAG